MSGKYCTMTEFETKVLDGIQDLAERIVRVETKLDVSTDRLNAYETRLTAVEKSIPDQDHETRLRKLERAIWIASGTALAGGSAAGAIISNITGA